MSGTFNLNNTSTITVSNSGNCIAQGSGGTTTISNEIVGAIKSFALTEVQMNNLDASYYLCDGRSCTGTSYESITGNSVVPDLRGKFLRGLDLTGSVDPDGAGRSLLDSQDDTFESHTHPYVNTTGSNTAHISGGPSVSARNLTNQNLTTSATGSDETRPKNNSVNFFIKVN